MKNFDLKKYLAEGKLLEAKECKCGKGETCKCNDIKEDASNNLVEDIIERLKDADLDGETMQYILEKIGMDYQMYKQLNVKYDDDFLNEADAIPTSTGKSEIDDDGERNNTVMSNAERKMALRSVIDVLGKQYPELSIDDKLDFVSIHAKDFFSGDVDPYSEEEIKNEYEEYSSVNFESGSDY